MNSPQQLKSALLQGVRLQTRAESLRAIGIILLGCLIAALGLVYFINPYGLVPGGVFGICIVLHAIFPVFQVGTYALMLQIPLMVVSTWVLGGKLGFRTLIAVFALPLMVNLISAWSYPDADALRHLDPALIAGGHLNMTEDLIISSLIGGALIGAGSGLIIRQQASSGGSDVIAMLLHRFSKIRFSTCMLMVDGTIVLAGLVVIGMGVGLSKSQDVGEQSWKLSLYSLIAMYVLNRTITMLMRGAQDCMLVHIICTHKDATLLRTWVLNTLNRTATCTQASGLYSEENKEILLMVVRDKELPAITDGIKLLAPDSFVVITDAYDVYGFRWKELPEANAVRLQ